MPSAFAHAFAAAALGAAFRWKGAPARFWIAGMGCAMLPDLDSVGFAFGIRYGDMLGHRGFSHSLASALVLALAAIILAFRRELRDGHGARIGAYLFLAAASHGFLDGFTNGGLGVAFFSPFDRTRYFFGFRPIEVSPINIHRFFQGRGWDVVRSEAIWVGVPFGAFALLSEMVRRTLLFRSRRATAILVIGIASAFGMLPAAASPALDAFGIAEFHPTRSGTREWNSAHWANGTARLIRYSGDPYDPTGWTDNHSSGGGDSLYVDGKGSLLIKGAGPRFHINSTGLYAGTPPAAKVPPQAFVDIEATGYARRLSAGGSAYDGMEIQVRTGPLAHASAGGDVCDATGYAARFRDDGNWDWEKELKHPESGVYSTRAGFSAPLFPGKTLPIGKWIGMKFLAYNVDGGAHVRLETYIDTVSDVGSGPPANGGHWEPVGSMVDDGADFPGGDVGGCPSLTPSMAITEGHGTVLIRTDNEACEWKFVSVREIDPTVTARLRPGRPRKGKPQAGRGARAVIPGAPVDAAGRRIGIKDPR